ncbi:hypothetical protein NDU88_004466 [Pleurodeles waltl]|uniref:Uncharacterized protein n=1 Tax=Pleurodeles waltl TaxID=8319 RepID=A0AAV7W915_PLEWA|nr:hypothetical protein NDU88_004466 [Pleurodeles waltl]
MSQCSSEDTPDIFGPEDLQEKCYVQGSAADEGTFSHENSSGSELEMQDYTLEQALIKYGRVNSDQRDTEAQARSGQLAHGNSEAPADYFRSGPGGLAVPRRWDTDARSGLRSRRASVMPMPAGLAGVLPLAHGDQSDSVAAAAWGRGLLAVLTHGRSERSGAGARGGVPTLTSVLEETLGL